jgi:Rrf2 family protein
VPASSRFAVAVHILTALALNEGRPVRSEQIARSAATHPVVIRRLLQALNEAGLTRSQLGQGGGALLARTVDQITLLDVFRATEEGALFALHRGEPDPHCIVGRNIQAVLRAATARAEAALGRELAGTTLADVAREIRSRA